MIRCKPHRCAFVASVWIALAISTSAGLAVAPNEPAPRLRGMLVEGSASDVRWDRSKLTVVNFWATWCEPCRQEMPELQSWLDRWESEGLRVFGVAKDPKKDAALIIAHLDGLGVTYPVFYPGEAISHRWGGIGTLPTTFLVDSEGIVIARFQGALPETMDALRQRVVEALGVDDIEDTDAAKAIDSADALVENESR